MSLYKAFMANWKNILGLAGLVLVGSLVYGLYEGWDTDRAKAGALAVDEVDRRMPKPSELAMYGLAPLDDLDDPNHVATLEEGARRYEGAGDANSGAMAASGYIKAGDTWLRLGNTENAKAAFEKAVDTREVGLLGWTAHNTLAVLALQEGDSAGAVAHWQAVADSEKSYLGEMALLSIVSTHEAAGENAAATKAAQQFLVAYPLSPRGSDLAQYSTPTPAPAPADG
ncbi:MAG: hypothetical protein GY913_08630 [Proteobacteria bacterium]|nr:hypothetical protein [Pseudomonadota bacterium]MCP4916976.1 hypothetical protein [Pseudomonadota bacterium]